MVVKGGQFFNGKKVAMYSFFCFFYFLLLPFLVSPFSSFSLFPLFPVSFSQESVDDIEQARHRQLMEVIGWFFFDLLMLGYVEDSDTGLSFHIPRGLAWGIYVEVCAHVLVDM